MTRIIFKCVFFLSLKVWFHRKWIDFQCIHTPQLCYGVVDWLNDQIHVFFDMWIETMNMSVSFIVYRARLWRVDILSGWLMVILDFNVFLLVKIRGTRMTRSVVINFIFNSLNESLITFRYFSFVAWYIQMAIVYVQCRSLK